MLRDEAFDRGLASLQVVTGKKLSDPQMDRLWDKFGTLDGQIWVKACDALSEELTYKSAFPSDRNIRDAVNAQRLRYGGTVEGPLCSFCRDRGTVPRFVEYEVEPGEPPKGQVGMVGCTCEAGEAFVRADRRRVCWTELSEEPPKSLGEMDRDVAEAENRFHDEVRRPWFLKHRPETFKRAGNLSLPELPSPPIPEPEEEEPLPF